MKYVYYLDLRGGEFGFGWYAEDYYGNQLCFSVDKIQARMRAESLGYNRFMVD